MNKPLLSGILFAVATVAPACVAFADDVDIEDLAARTGLSERQVRMVLGPSTAYAEYRTSYDFARERVDEAILEDQVRPAVVVGEVQAAPATTTTTTTTYSAETVPYDETATSTEQLRSDDEDDNGYDRDYDDD